jgi:hypothetical protein
MNYVAIFNDTGLPGARPQRQKVKRRDPRGGWSVGLMVGAVVGGTGR